MIEILKLPFHGVQQIVYTYDVHAIWKEAGKLQWHISETEHKETLNCHCMKKTNKNHNRNNLLTLILWRSMIIYVSNGFLI